MDTKYNQSETASADITCTITTNTKVISGTKELQGGRKVNRCTTTVDMLQTKNLGADTKKHVAQLCLKT